MKRIIVLGGTGFLGSRTVRALSSVPGFEVHPASRHTQPPVDCTRPETFGALEGAALVIDLSNATTTPPDELIDWCLAHQVPVLEATSDSSCLERLSQRFAGTTGRLVLGGGIFTGLSNLLARSAADQAQATTGLTLGIASSPFSGAGVGTIELMISILATPVVRWEGGRRVEATLGAAPVVDFPLARRPTLRAPFAEAFMLHASTHVPNVEVLFAPKPGALVTAFTLLPAAFGRSRLGQSLLRAYFTVLRRWVLHSVSTSVELIATATGVSTVTRSLVTTDGMQAGAWALAATAEGVLGRTGAGVQFIDEVVGLDAIVARANELAGHQIVEVTPWPNAPN